MIANSHKLMHARAAANNRKIANLYMARDHSVIGQNDMIAQNAVMLLLRLLLPPHVDNEKAADHLRTEIGQDHRAVEWSVVRPDNLTNEKTVSDYELHSSPTRSAIFNPGVSSRMNVAHFMAELVTNDATWNKWKGQMPVIYNQPQEQ